MNKKLFTAYLIFIFMAVSSVYSQTVSIDNAVSDCVHYLQNRYPNGTRAALIFIQSENAELGELVLNKMSAALVNNNWFRVVERNAAVLEQIDQELYRNRSLIISRDTALSLGRQLGAQIIISGSFTRNGQNWMLDIQAVNAESAERTAHHISENIQSDSSWSFLAAHRSAGLFFTDYAFAPRETQTITSAFRQALQTFNTGLALNENAAQGAGLCFNIDIFLMNTPSGLLQAEVSISLLQDSRILLESKQYIIRELTETMTARRISEEIRDDREFFARVNSLIR
ncbi:MAG: penicillin-binding protein activator LpoB [Treponema sp.]|nr:penicillin-binding protein activator LpoB [Treponema sp.]